MRDAGAAVAQSTSSNTGSGMSMVAEERAEAFACVTKTSLIELATSRTPPALAQRATLAALCLLRPTFAATFPDRTPLAESWRGAREMLREPLLLQILWESADPLAAELGSVQRRTLCHARHYLGHDVTVATVARISPAAAGLLGWCLAACDVHDARVMRAQREACAAAAHALACDADAAERVVLCASLAKVSAERHRLRAAVADALVSRRREIDRQDETTTMFPTISVGPTETIGHDAAAGAGHAAAEHLAIIEGARATTRNEHDDDDELFGSLLSLDCGTRRATMALGTTSIENDVMYHAAERAGCDAGRDAGRDAGGVADAELFFWEEGDLGELRRHACDPHHEDDSDVEPVAPRGARSYRLLDLSLGLGTHHADLHRHCHRRQSGAYTDADDGHDGHDGPDGHDGHDGAPFSFATSSAASSRSFCTRSVTSSTPGADDAAPSPFLAWQGKRPVAHSRVATLKIRAAAGRARRPQLWSELDHGGVNDAPLEDHAGV